MAIESGARKLGIPGKEIHGIFYSTKFYQQFSDPKYGLQLMSDDHIPELIEEVRDTPCCQYFLNRCRYEGRVLNL